MVALPADPEAILALGEMSDLARKWEDQHHNDPASIAALQWRLAPEAATLELAYAIVQVGDALTAERRGEIIAIGAALFFVRERLRGGK